jgi:hypothetical protein
VEVYTLCVTGDRPAKQSHNKHAYNAKMSHFCIPPEIGRDGAKTLRSLDKVR